MSRSTRICFRFLSLEVSEDTRGHHCSARRHSITGGLNSCSIHQSGPCLEKLGCPGHPSGASSRRCLGIGEGCSPKPVLVCCRALKVGLWSEPTPVCPNNSESVWLSLPGGPEPMLLVVREPVLSQKLASLKIYQMIPVSHSTFPSTSAALRSFLALRPPLSTTAPSGSIKTRASLPRARLRKGKQSNQKLMRAPPIVENSHKCYEGEVSEVYRAISNTVYPQVTVKCIGCKYNDNTKSKFWGISSLRSHLRGVTLLQ
ncbi:hypothetical protein BSL78_23447 [Apostichopus japonicus]|uniref:Uncharacterized protein n=1 Tax=Stichopus japonicus TaxID=307972 RepID=A0A2G8JVL0_STIJA|nr:hypothetical protein BSL78_23447 [Apostichopus japonicus]